jgi:hypothetical protein
MSLLPVVAVVRQLVPVEDERTSWQLQVQRHLGRKSPLGISRRPLACQIGRSSRGRMLYSTPANSSAGLISSARATKVRHVLCAGGLSMWLVCAWLVGMLPACMCWHAPCCSSCCPNSRTVLVLICRPASSPQLDLGGDTAVLRNGT